MKTTAGNGSVNPQFSTCAYMDVQHTKMWFNHNNF